MRQIPQPKLKFLQVFKALEEKTPSNPCHVFDEEAKSFDKRIGSYWKWKEHLLGKTMADRHTWIKTFMSFMTLWKTRVTNEEAFFCKSSSRPMHFSAQFSLVFKQIIFCLLPAKLVLRRTISSHQKHMLDNKCHTHTHVKIVLMGI